MHQVVGTEWQANIVQDAVDFIRRNLFANGGLYQVGQLRRVLNASPGLRADVQAELTAIRVGEEVLPEPRRQEKGADAKSEKCGNEDLAARDQTSQQTLMGGPNTGEALLEFSLKEHQRVTRLAAALAQFEHVHRKRRHQRSREEVGREHSEDHRLRQGYEEKACDTAKQEQGHEDDADTQR